jgi:outer membrane protein assembly factor BamB
VEEARRLLEQMAGGDGPLPERVRAAGRLLALEPPSGGEAAADRFLAGLKLPAGVDAGWVSGPNGIPTRLRTLANRHFGVTEPTRSPPPSAPPTFPTGEFDPLSVSGLGPTAKVDRVTELPSAGFVPLRPFGGAGLPGLGRDAGDRPLLLVTDSRRVLAYRPGADQPTWSADLPTTHAAGAGDGFLLADARGVAKVRRADGGTVWSFRLPDADPLPPGLADFVLAGNRLVARLGDHHLIALDTADGSVAWLLDTLGRSRYAPFPAGRLPRFSPGLYADERAVIVQLSTGRRWVVSAETGNEPRDAPNLLTEWATPPVRATADEVIVPAEPGKVTTVHADRNRVTATFRPALPEASLTGRPPALKAVPGGVVVGVSRNHGVELHRLRAPRLDLMWAGEPPLIPGADLSAADADESALYVPVDGRLYAVSLANGRRLWDVPTGDGWRVRAGRRVVIAYPTEAVPVDPPAEVARRLVDRFTFAPAGVYGGWADRTVPVLVLDPNTGRTLRRLDLPAVGPVVGAHFGPEHNVVVTAGRAYWLQSP